MDTLKMAFVAIAIIGTVLCNAKNAGADGLVHRSGAGWDDFALAAAQTVVCEEEQEATNRPCILPQISAVVWENGNTVKIKITVPSSELTHSRAIERLVRAVFRSRVRGYRLTVEVRGRNEATLVASR